MRVVDGPGDLHGLTERPELGIIEAGVPATEAEHRTGAMTEAAFGKTA